MNFWTLNCCYSVSRVPVSGGGELVLYDLHLSAYTSDGTIATEQLALLLADMQAEYEKGSWCVAGGDFNEGDLLGTPPPISARRSRNTPGRSPYRRACSTAMTCSWWRHWTRTIRCHPAATPTAIPRRPVCHSPWMASWSPQCCRGQCRCFGYRLCLLRSQPGTDDVCPAKSKQSTPVTGCFFHRKAGKVRVYS